MFLAVGINLHSSIGESTKRSNDSIQWGLTLQAMDHVADGRSDTVVPLRSVRSSDALTTADSPGVYSTRVYVLNNLHSKFIYGGAQHSNTKLLQVYNTPAFLEIYPIQYREIDCFATYINLSLLAA